MKLTTNAMKITSLCLLFTAIFIISCSKENSNSTPTDEQELTASVASSEGEAEADATFNNIFDDVMGANDEVGVSGSGIFFGRGDSLTPVPRCFTVTITHPTSNPFPVIVKVDFGATGCLGPDGHVRRGIVRTEYSARLIVREAKATTTFDGYYVDSVKVEGTHIITNTSELNSPANRRFKVQVIDGKLTKPSGNYIKWNSTKTISLVEGGLTLTPLDDIFKIEGSSRGQILRGNLLVGWESNITEPLVKRMTCPWIVKGIIKTVRINTAATSPWISLLNFGNGQCDNKATLTINGRTIEISLP